MRQTRRGIRRGSRNWTPLATDHTTLYTRSPLSLCASTTFRPSFLRSIPEIAPRTVCCLCRHRHKPHYADAKIMPTDVGNTSCVVGIVAMESA